MIIDHYCFTIVCETIVVYVMIERKRDPHKNRFSKSPSLYQVLHLSSQLLGFLLGRAVMHEGGWEVLPPFLVRSRKDAQPTAKAETDSTRLVTCKLWSFVYKYGFIKASKTNLAPLEFSFFLTRLELDCEWFLQPPGSIV